MRVPVAECANYELPLCPLSPAHVAKNILTLNSWLIIRHPTIPQCHVLKLATRITLWVGYYLFVITFHKHNQSIDTTIFYTTYGTIII